MREIFQESQQISNSSEKIDYIELWGLCFGHEPGFSETDARRLCFSVPALRKGVEKNKDRQKKTTENH